MGYTTDFNGQFDISPTLKKEHREYLELFCRTRRMKRNPIIAESLENPIREAVCLSTGDEGGYFVGGYGELGQGYDESITDNNTPPIDQPGLWCKWIPNENGDAIEWDGGEKFYNYVEWLEYIIEHFLAPWGYVLNGEVEWFGEDKDDTGIIMVKDNEMMRDRLLP